jgi:two-component system, OmpR family, phosphate regulon sensor histidine kinase PhoR
VHVAALKGESAAARAGAMSLQQGQTVTRRGARAWHRRLARARLVVAAAAVLFFALAIGGALTVPQAIAGFAVLALAALLAGGESEPVVVASAPQRAEPNADERLLQPLVDSLPDAVIALASDGRVVALNDRARAFASALRLGEPAALALRAPELVEAIGRVRDGGAEQHVQIAEKVPSDRWFEIFVAPVRRKSGVPAGRPDFIVITLHDLTPLRRVEEMRADFVANASHELRTPLAALSGFIDTLQGPARDDAEARARFLAIMQQQAGRMARLIDDLLSLSRIELNVHRRPDTPIDLVSIVRQVANGLETLARDRGVTINIDAAGGPLVVPGDRDELIRLFENLVENALKYGAAGKRVDIRLWRQPKPDGQGEVVATVRDYGPGIAPEHLPRLTERFYRVDVGESRTQGGTGLGLALVKHILNRHRGQLDIASVPGQGATFTIRIPSTGELRSQREISAKSSA